MPEVRLTPREEQVLRHVRSGSSNKDIADTLGVGEQAVKALVSRLLLKYGVSNRTTLAGTPHRSLPRAERTHNLDDALARSRDLRERNQELMEVVRRGMREFRSSRQRLRQTLRAGGDQSEPVLLSAAGPTRPTPSAIAAPDR